MNLASEIEFYSELRLLDKARLLNLFMHELAQEARGTYGAGAAEGHDSAPVSQAAPSAATLLRPARVWTAGEPVHEGWVVLIRGSRIVAVGAAGTARAEAGARVIELPGATLLPGLMDAHSHLFLHPYDQTRWD